MASIKEIEDMQNKLIKNIEKDMTHRPLTIFEKTIMKLAFCDGMSFAISEFKKA